jgi:hypothetical protein
MNLRREKICGHCLRVCEGWGGAEGQNLCHPEPGRLDCYTLVTLYYHPMACAVCLEVVQVPESEAWFSQPKHSWSLTNEAIRRAQKIDTTPPGGDTDK